jgi:hypothetical protein
MAGEIQVTKERFEDVGDLDESGRPEYRYQGYNYEIMVDGRTFHVRSYGEVPVEAIVGTPRPDVSVPRLRKLVDYLTQVLGFSTVKFYSGRHGFYRRIDTTTLEFVE